MSMFFETDTDPTEVAAMIIGSAMDCVPTGNGALDEFIASLDARFERGGGIAGFDGDAVQLCEDAGIALDTVIATTRDEAARELACMTVMALDEARATDAWSDAGTASLAAR